MKIANNHVVNIKYKLTNNDGDVLDQSEDGSFGFLMGAQNIIPGLENALLEKSVGDSFDVKIPPAEAYGEHNEALLHSVPRTQFPQDIVIQPGMQFQGQTAEGQMTVVTVKDIEGDQVIIDNNHPLAGVELNFAVEVTNIREATQVEIEHGHIHDENSHC